MRVVVIDGQGGRVGKTLIERLVAEGCCCEITAVGTNSIATAAMMKAGADNGATGENPVVVLTQKADIIIGPVGIIAADSLFGEVTERMASAVARSDARKLLIPINKCNITVAGTEKLSMNEYIDDVVATVKEMCK